MSMMKTLTVALVGLGWLAGQAHAVTGEYWEVKVKVEMKGMPFAMPETTQKVCVAEGANDPARTVTDKDCEVLDSKTSGNKVTWKVRCVKKGEEMTGTGEVTSGPDSYKGMMHMTGRMEGEPVDMTQHFSGRKVGGACDADAPKKEMARLKAQADAQVASSCDPAQSESSSQLIMAAGMYFGAKPLCADRAKDYCGRISKDVMKQPQAFETLVAVQKDPKMSGGVDVAKSCAIDVLKAQASVCKNNAEGSLDFLDRHCPAEAKAKRDREAAARSFTAGKPRNPADNLIDNAKKLKGLFGL